MTYRYSPRYRPSQYQLNAILRQYNFRPNPEPYQDEIDWYNLGNQPVIGAVIFANGLAMHKAAKTALQAQWPGVLFTTSVYGFHGPTVVSDPPDEDILGVLDYYRQISQHLQQFVLAFPKHSDFDNYRAWASAHGYYVVNY